MIKKALKVAFCLFYIGYTIYMYLLTGFAFIFVVWFIMIISVADYWNVTRR
jgi:hypothetical protein